MTLDEILGRMQRSGLRDSAPRRAVVEAVCRRAGSFTAQEIADELAPRGIGRATVFRALALLQELGYVSRLHAGAECDRYALCDPTHHHHLVCTGCGSVFPLDACTIDEQAARAAEEIGFRVAGHHLDVYGRCASCA